MALLLDPSFLEHDAYALFVALMARVAPWYEAMPPQAPPRKVSSVKDECPFANTQQVREENKQTIKQNLLTINSRFTIAITQYTRKKFLSPK